MTKTEYKNKTIGYISNILSSAEIDKKIDRYLSSGAIDFTNTDENDYTTIKAIAYVIFKDIANSARPLTNKGLLEVNNLLHF